PVASHPRHPRAPALAVAEQVSLDAGPHLVRLVHGQRLADVVEQTPGAFEMAVGAALQPLSSQTQLLAPLGGVLLHAPGRCPVGAKPLPRVALQSALDRVHGSEELLQAPALAITVDHQWEHDDADLLRPLPEELLAPSSEAAVASRRHGAPDGRRWLNSH